MRPTRRAGALILIVLAVGSACGESGSIEIGQATTTSTTTEAPTTTRYVAPTTTIRTLHQELTVFFVDTEVVRVIDTYSKASGQEVAPTMKAAADTLDEKRAALSPEASALVGAWAAGLRKYATVLTDGYKDASGQIVPFEELLTLQQEAIDETTTAFDALMAAKNG
jgi:hypothetical protein